MTNPRRPSRVALITGASTGLGETVAEFLGGAGWSLVLTARTESDLTAVAKRLTDRAATVRAVAGDVGEAAHRERLIAEAGSLGRLDQQRRRVAWFTRYRRITTASSAWSADAVIGPKSPTAGV
ncbi:SDR family NAD(P)-dependent oxidoreductase [Streptomyces sp. NPDC058011]|uniref:SDR family NAD(P)-dependent oxidoreductase n=1 Tax=Streptomyces sp. NPDC058011 TaxID=3346305 RepID=UPI0036E2C4AF